MYILSQRAQHWAKDPRSHLTSIAQWGRLTSLDLLALLFLMLTRMLLVFFASKLFAGLWSSYHLPEPQILFVELLSSFLTPVYIWGAWDYSCCMQGLALLLVDFDEVYCWPISPIFSGLWVAAKLPSVSATLSYVILPPNCWEYALSNPPGH